MFKIFTLCVLLVVADQMISTNANRCSGNETLSTTKCVTQCPPRCPVFGFSPGPVCLGQRCYDKLPCVCKPGYLYRTLENKSCVKREDCPKIPKIQSE